MSLREDIEEVRDEVRDMNSQSLAYELVKDYKKQNKRLFIIWVITFLTLMGLTCYTVYLLNDIENIEHTKITQENSTGYNNYIGNDGDISNGTTNDRNN